MRIVLLFTLILACMPKQHFSTGEITELNPNGPWVEYLTMPVCANVRATVTLASKDSTVLYTLFDNTLTRSQTLVMMYQPAYWERRSMAKDRDDIVLIPIPPLKLGFYCFAYSSGQTTIVDTVYYMP